MDNTIIAAIIGGICVIVAAVVGVVGAWFQKRQKAHVKVGKRATTGEINVDSPHDNTIIEFNRE